MVRAELMEQVPHLAMYCQENNHMFTNPITTYILPTVVKYLIDSNNQVNKIHHRSPFYWRHTLKYLLRH